MARLVPRISVVTISFNQARFLRTAINSVLNQGIDDLEYIVIDPGSTDGSRQIIEEYGDRLQYLFEPDRGPADGLNKGFAHAGGDIFYFLNADDAVLPGVFPAVLEIFSRRPEIDLIYGGGYIVDEKGSPVKFIWPTKFSAERYVAGATNLLQQSVFFRRKCFETVGGFNVENRLAWDGELLFHIWRAGVVSLPLYSAMGAFRIYEGTITSQVQHQRRLASYRHELATRFGYGDLLNQSVLSRLRWWVMKQVSKGEILLETRKLEQTGIGAVAELWPSARRREVAQRWCK